jgi:mannose-1-phosphate guanylyltransferase
MLHAVIMAGGSGTRFWPQSRQRRPKQLLALAGDDTMLQQTVSRCAPFADPVRTWVVTNSVQADATRAQLPDVPAGNTLVEPAARNTAPCVGLAAVRLLKDDPDAVMFVMPADHVIRPVEQFAESARQAARIVSDDPSRLVLFGVNPTFPATGYGYIERGGRVDFSGAHVFEVSAFREKPQRSVAEEYLRQGTFYWNCGIFCWKASTIVDLLKQHEPEIHAHLMTISEAMGTADEQQVLDTHFPLMKSISIDYAVLERASAVTVIEAPFEWDDVGSWPALARLNTTDDRGNTAQGQVCLLDTDDCIVRSQDDHLVATLGVRDLIVVHTADVTLVADVAHSERVKEILTELQTRDLTEFL